VTSDRAVPVDVRPPRYKLALVTWLGAFPTITLLLWVLGPFTAQWPLVPRSFVLSGLMVFALSWLVLPLLTRALAGWLLRR
jgi:uncharacterized protein